MQTPLTFAEILSALSHALDITEGQPRGHAVRTAYIALRIGKELQLPDTDMRDLYKASLLKDAGCSSNAVRVYKVFADDLLTLTPLDRAQRGRFFLARLEWWAERPRSQRSACWERERLARMATETPCSATPRTCTPAKNLPL